MPDSLLTFPCPFTFKVIGRSGTDFEGAVVQIFRTHYPHLGEGAIHTKPSKNDNYTALSITVTVDSQEQLDATYQELSNHPFVLFAL